MRVVKPATMTRHMMKELVYSSLVSEQMENIRSKQIFWYVCLCENQTQERATFAVVTFKYQ